MPENLWNALEDARKQSGFASVGDQIRYELMVPRGMWKAPVLPAQLAPVKG